MFFCTLGTLALRLTLWGRGKHKISLAHPLYPLSRCWLWALKPEGRRTLSPEPARINSKDTVNHYYYSITIVFLQEVVNIIIVTNIPNNNQSQPGGKPSLIRQPASQQSRGSSNMTYVMYCDLCCLILLLLPYRKITMCYTHETARRLQTKRATLRGQRPTTCTPNLPTNMIHANMAGLKLSGRFPVDMRIPPLKMKIMFESNPLNSTMLVGRLGVPVSEENTPLEKKTC